MEEELAGNPFAALFPNLAAAEEQLQQTTNKTGVQHQTSTPENVADKTIAAVDADIAAENVAGTDKTTTDAAKRAPVADMSDEEMSYLLEKTFLITVDPGLTESRDTRRPPAAVLLVDLISDDSSFLSCDAEALTQAVEARAVMTSAGEAVITRAAGWEDAEGCGEATLDYLSSCYWRLYRHAQMFAKQLSERDVARLLSARGVAVEVSRRLLQLPQVSPGRDVRRDLQALVGAAPGMEDSDVVVSYIVEVTKAVSQNPTGGATLLHVLRPTLDTLRQRFLDDVIVGAPALWTLCDLAEFFVSQKHLAEVFMEHHEERIRKGRDYQRTILGGMLALGILPKSDRDLPEFFATPSRYRQTEISAEENRLHGSLSELHERAHAIVLRIMKYGPDLKRRLLRWVGGFLRTNKVRGQMVAQELPALVLSEYASPACLLGLASVLLRLSKPLVTRGQMKLDKLQHGYLLAPGSSGASLTGLSDETALIPVAENERPGVPETFTTATELFYMTHFALKLAFHPANQRFVKINRELHQIQQSYQEAERGGADANTTERLRGNMDIGMTQFLSYKAALTEPVLLELSGSLHSATALWLSTLALRGTYTHQPLAWPIGEEASPILSTLPEMLVTNIMDFVIFVKRFKDSVFEGAEQEMLGGLLDLGLVFMGSPHRLQNPHLRAQMAEMLEATLPPAHDSGYGLASANRAWLWRNHAGLDSVLSAVLNVFVNIETTGQSVEFESKFNYRRPMYVILETLWAEDRHRIVAKDLCRDALEKAEAPDPPLFLKFVNHLINDAIFLLDEALGFLMQIKTKQEARDSGAWQELSAEDRQTEENNLRQIGMMARYHNQMGLDTIKTLQMLATDCISVLTYPTMVDRVAGMLNYFLVQLVGPKKRNLAVKNFEQDFAFKPKEVVSVICQLYLDLDGDAFCNAVAADKRSYSPDLFPRAQHVLEKIGQAEKAQALGEVAVRVKRCSDEQEAEEEYLSDPPDEFLDPIMGSLMTDPVTLPTSHKTVDRQTIARHVLSDQFDPFNREPLTMEQVIPNEEMKARIEAWITEQKRNRRNQTADSS